MIRQLISKNFIRVNYHISKTAERFFSKYTGESSSSDSDDEPTISQTKNTLVSSSRLNNLLASMKVIDKTLNDKSLDVTLRSLKKRQENRKLPSSNKIKDIQSLEKATKVVAESFGEDVRQTESELLRKLLEISNQATEEKVRAEGGEDASKLNDIIVGMKIERIKKSEMRISDDGKIARRGGNARRTDDWERIFRERIPKSRSLEQERLDRINFWSAQLLKLFPQGLKKSNDHLKVWNLLQNRELLETFETAPRNYYEKMQRWTVEGKIWRFPIDNEQGLEEEAKVYFADHVFLEPYLELWCPKSGPVRHFMELVCVGLSKNPYITVCEKQEHIAWFREYFEVKKELLQEIVVQDCEPHQGTIGDKANK